MKRRELELAIRAASRLVRGSDFLLMGSQAVHGSCRRPPAEVLLSQECDLYPKDLGKINVLCLDLLDLVVSKLAAGRLKDLMSAFSDAHVWRHRNGQRKVHWKMRGGFRLGLTDDLAKERFVNRVPNQISII